MRVAFLIFLFGMNSLGIAASVSPGPLLQTSFIWSQIDTPEKPQYVAFRKKLALSQDPYEACLHLFADSRYILWINGNYVERGPCRFDPKGPQYDSVDVTPYLRKGDNVIAILVHHYHGGAKSSADPDINGRMMRHRPGLTACLEWQNHKDTPLQKIVTDASWRCKTETKYLPDTEQNWQQHWGSISDNIDASRSDGDWTLANYNDSQWQLAVAIPGDSWGKLESRLRKGIPLLRETPVVPLRKLGSAPGNGPLLEKCLPVTLQKGEELYIDPGRFVLAYVDMQLEADKGSQLLFTYPQQYFSTGNRPVGSHPKSSYTAKGGQERYISLDVFGMRYMRVICKRGRVQIKSLKLTERLYPFDVVGNFTSSDEKLNTIWKIGLDTVLCCSEDAYVDCVCRERAEWLGDAVLVAFPVTSVTTRGPPMAGQPTYGDARLFRNLLRHIAQSQQPDGRVKAHHPSDRWDKHGYIEDYACLWIQGVRTYYRQTGDIDFVREMLPTIERQLAWFQNHLTEKELVHAREFLFTSNPLAYQTCEGTTLNCYLYRSLQDAAALEQLACNNSKAKDFQQQANNLKKAINEQLWDADTKSYYGGLFGKEKAPANAHAAMTAIYFDVVPKERKASVQAFLLAHYGKERWEPYSARLLLETLFRLEKSKQSLDFIRQYWTPMTELETQSTWEGFSPGECCHECGASPTWLLSTFVLGVQPTKNASEPHVYIKPHLDNLTSAEGTVMTPHGPVYVAWRIESQNQLAAKLILPDGVDATVDLTQLGGAIFKHVRSNKYHWTISKAVSLPN